MTQKKRVIKGGIAKTDKGYVFTLSLWVDDKLEADPVGPYGPFETRELCEQKMNQSAELAASNFKAIFNKEKNDIH